jgi:hypothetical protein
LSPLFVLVGFMQETGEDAELPAFNTRR